MHNKNTCLTYFVIKGDFPVDSITEMLGLSPSQSWNYGDIRKDGKTRYDFSLWEYGRCSKYDINVAIILAINVMA